MAKDDGRYFDDGFFDFLSDLKRHNDRDWFAKNKPRYEADVQAPAVRFIADAGAVLRPLSKHIVADPKPFGGSMSRIYRDTRFSKDKSPYQTHIGIHFSHDGATKEKPHLPGFFVHLEPGEVGVYSGVWRPEGPELSGIRNAIVAKPAEWKKVTKAPIKMYGEALKRPPPGFAADHPLIEDLKRKDFIGPVDLKQAQVTGPGFMKDFATACEKLEPLNAFLSKAMGVPW